MNIRPYQLACQNAVRDGWENFSKQLVVKPTGSGKTIVFSRIAREVADDGERTLVLVDQSELAWQTVDKMKRAADLICEVEKAEFSATLDAQVVVATVQTMARRLEDWPRDHFRLVIADEADKSLAASWQSVLKHFDGSARVCGFTATPNRSDQRNLGEYYENIAFEAALFDFIGNGKWAFDEVDGVRVQKNWLSPISVKMLPIAIDLNSVRTKGGDFDPNELNDAITPHLTQAAEAIRDHASFRMTLVFVPLIATSIKFVEICRSVGLHAEHIDGTSEDREEKLKRFEAGEFDVLCNSQLLARGVDIPSIDCVVDLSPTKSVSLYMQRIGRGTRLAQGKENLLLLDFLYDAQKKMICRPANLIAKSQEEADAITEISKGGCPPIDAIGEQLTALDLLGMQSEAQAKRERALRKKLEEHKDKKSKFISAEEFAMKSNRSDIAEFDPVMKWEADKVTDKQAKYLKQAGIDIETVRGKGHASKLLSLYFTNKPVQLASYGQRQKMRQMGYANWESATAQEARQFFAALNKPREEVLL